MVDKPITPGPEPSLRFILHKLYFYNLFLKWLLFELFKEFKKEPLHSCHVPHFRSLPVQSSSEQPQVISILQAAAPAPMGRCPAAEVASGVHKEGEKLDKGDTVVNNLDTDRPAAVPWLTQPAPLPR